MIYQEFTVYRLRIMRLAFVVFTLLITISSGWSQKGWEAGGWVGLSQYFGDLNNQIAINEPGFAFGVLGKRNFNDRLSLRGSLSFARIAADDVNSNNNFERNRNLSFRSRLFEVGSAVEFNFFPFIHGHREFGYTPYMVAGFSVFSFAPKADLNGQEFDLRELGTEGQLQTGTYGIASGALMLGLGWKMSMSEEWSVNIELGYRRTFTDYLDDVSTVYPSLEFLPTEEARALSDRSLVEGIGVPGRQRGDSTGNDSYIFVGVSVLKYWGFLECPKISRWK